MHVRILLEEGIITDDDAQLTVQRTIHEQGASGGMRDKRAAQRFRLRLDGILRLAAERITELAMLLQSQEETTYLLRAYHASCSVGKVGVGLEPCVVRLSPRGRPRRRHRQQR
jgi:hypothetical protein